MVRSAALAPKRRRAHIRRTFDSMVDQEWARFAGDAPHLLLRRLRERFLELHLRSSKGVLLELGPGPGRFTPLLREHWGGAVISLDLSRASLQAGRRRSRGGRGRAPVEFVQGAGEHLPLLTGSVHTAVALGNIVAFASGGGPALLNELHRVVRPSGVLILDFASPASSVQEFLHRAARGGFLVPILRRPQHYLVNSVLDSGYQPYAPSRMSRWEFRFYTAPEASGLLRRAGFRPTDTMSFAPLTAFQDRVASIALRDRHAWKNLLRTEEKVGRRPGMLETGYGFVIAAVRT